MKIILSGGGTLGPVVPLLALAEQVRAIDSSIRFVWVGTSSGPEKELVEKFRMDFYTITAGKWRRYFSVWNILDLFRVTFAFIHSIVFLWQERPDLLISAGGFVSVPLHWAGWVMGIPTWVHQQDAETGLANRLMAKVATKITTAMEENVNDFPLKKTEWLGNPCRDLAADKATAKLRWGIPTSSPVIFVTGGGTGSMKVNQMILEALPSWPKEWHVIHLTGKERSSELNEKAAEVFRNYHVHKFFVDEMKDAYAAADVVIARGGFGTLTELAALHKASVIVPISHTHQEKNVDWLAKNKAVVVINEETDNGLKLAKVVTDIILDPKGKEIMGEKLGELLPRAKPERIREIINELIKK